MQNQDKHQHHHSPKYNFFTRKKQPTKDDNDIDTDSEFVLGFLNPDLNKQSTTSTKTSSPKATSARRFRSGTIPSSFSPNLIRFNEDKLETPTKNSLINNSFFDGLETPQMKQKTNSEERIPTLNNHHHDFSTKPNKTVDFTFAKKHQRNNTIEVPNSNHYSRKNRSYSLFSPWNDKADIFRDISYNKDQPEDTISISKTLDYLRLDEDETNELIRKSPTNKKSEKTNKDYNQEFDGYSQDVISSEIIKNPNSSRYRSKSFTVSNIFQKRNNSGVFNQENKLKTIHSRKLSECHSNLNNPNYEEGNFNEFNEGVLKLEPPVPSRSVWVGNIDPGVTNIELELVFAPFGEIESLRMLPEKECAFINYYNVDDAIRARDVMQGSKIGNCIVRVGFGKTDTFQNDVNATLPTRALWVGNVPPQVTPNQLQTLFSKFGKIESCRILTHKSCGFVNYFDINDATKAKSTMNYQELEGTVIRIGFAKAPGNSADCDPAIVTNNNSEEEKSRNNSLKHSRNPSETISHYDNQLSLLDENNNLIKYKPVNADSYNYRIPPLPILIHRKSKPDQHRLKEIKRDLNNNEYSDNTPEFVNIFEETCEFAVELCTDYVGNTVIQKLLEISNEQQKNILVEKVAPYMASIGIHKNGTWAIQKIIKVAQTHHQIKLIVESLKYLTPSLLLDQFGNYVIQGCLKFGSEYNQFIFDAIYEMFLEIALGRYGARAIRTCLENNNCSNKQQLKIATAIVNNTDQLIMDQNGSILITWLLDCSSIKNRYLCIYEKIKHNLQLYSKQKQGSINILRIINQTEEPHTRNNLINDICTQATYNSNGYYHLSQESSSNSSSILDFYNLIQKSMSSNCLNTSERELLIQTLNNINSKYSSNNNDINNNEMDSFYYKNNLQRNSSFQDNERSLEENVFYFNKKQQQ